MAFHKLYLHLGVNKTKMLILRHFWGEALNRRVRLVRGNCTRCKTSKINLAPMHVESSYPGEWVLIDMYGPLPKCSGGCTALLVALDILSGYVMPFPLKDTKGDAFISTTKKRIKHPKGLNITVEKLLSDNGRQFCGRKYLDFCSQVRIKKIFTTTYKPPPPVTSLKG